MKRVIIAASVAALSFVGMAETTRDYVQDGLIAFWDGIENGGTARTHVSRTPGETFLWRDVVGNRAFTMLSDAQIEPDRVRFLDTADSRGSLTEEDSSAVFNACRDGTVELVFYGGTANTSAIFLYCPSESGIVVGRKSDCMAFAYNTTGSYRTCAKTFVNTTNTFALTYSDGLLMSKGGLYINAVSNAVGTSTKVSYATGDARTWIGGGSSGVTPCNGAIYAIRCYSRKLTPEEIAANAAVDAERFFGGRGVTFSQTAANALSATLTADVNEELATGCSAKVCYGASPDALTETQAFGETFGEAGSYDITIRGLAPATTNYAQLVLTSGNSETPVYPVIAFTTAAVKPLPSGTGIGRGLKDYAQTGLVAHWDGVKNVGANLVHSDETKRWVDCLGGRAFDLRGVTVGDSYLQFAGATTSYGVLDAAGTKDIFETYGPSGTVEVAFMATKNANAIVLKSTYASGVALGWTDKTILCSASAASSPAMSTHKASTYPNKFYVLSPNYTKKAYAPTVYVNGVANTPTGDNNYWGTDVTGTYIGRRGGGATNSENPYAGKIYAIRVYDHNLTAEEAAQNYAVDVERFVNGNCAEPGDLRVEGGLGTSVPVEGLYEGLAVGEPVACSCAAATTDPETGDSLVSMGYVVYTNGVVCAEGTTNEFTYVHPDCATGAKLVWRWAHGLSAVGFAQCGSGAFTATLAANVLGINDAAYSAEIRYGSAEDALTETKVIGTGLTETGRIEVTIADLPYNTGPLYAELVLSNGKGETFVTPVVEFATSRGKPLPAEYQELASIRSTGAQYVDTGYVPSSAKTGVIMKFNSGASGDNTAYFGQEWKASRYVFSRESSLYKFRAGPATLTNVSVNCDMTLTVTPNGSGAGRLVLDNPGGPEWQAYTNAAVSLSVSTTLTLKLFGFSGGYRSAYTLYRFTITERDAETGEHVPVHDFVPCRKIATGEIGLYDALAADPATAFKTNLYASATTAFVPGEEVHYLDELVVTAGPDEYGTVAPGYGRIEALRVGDTVPCEAPAEAVLDADRTRAVCVGYKVYTNGVVSVQGSERAFTYVHPDCATGAKLVWQWQRQHRVTVSAGAGGAVSPSAAWVIEGSNTVFTATPDDGCEFLMWRGEVVRFDATLSTLVTKPQGFAALFAPVAKQRKVWTGLASTTSWEDAGNWDPNGVPTFADDVSLSANVYVVVPNGAVKANSISLADTAELHLETDANEILVGKGGFSMVGTSRFFVGTNSNASAGDAFAVAGDFSAVGSSAVTICAGRGAGDAPDWRDYKRGGTAVDVAGDFTVSNKVNVTANAHPVTGLGVVFNAGGDVTFASGTKITSLGWPKGKGPGYKSGSGGSYGGIGHSSTAAYLYGFAAAPYQPGSGGADRQGGGSVRLAAAGNVNLSGTISTKGVASTGSGDYAGSGGGIWITCADFLPGDGASVDAGGGMANGGNSGAAPGGGGRVAIMTGSPTEEQIEDLYSTGSCGQMTILSTNMNDETTCSYPTVVNVKGGKRVSGALAGPGTTVLMKNSAGLVQIEIGGNVYTPLATPSYGLDLKFAGEHTFTVPKYVDVSGGEFTAASVSRYECLGYEWTDAEGTVHTGGDTNVTLDVTGDISFRWIWSAVQYHFTMISGGYGSVSAHDDWYAEGTEVAIVATPDADCNFVRWAGETTAADTSAASSTIVLDKPRRVTAVFDKPGVADRNFSISGDIDWFDPAAWDGTAIPTTNDTVTVTNNTTIELSSVMDVKALVVSAGTATFAGNDTAIALNVVEGLTIENKAAMTLGAGSRKAFTDLTVGGDLTLNGTGTLTIYAGGGAVTSPAWTDFKRGGSRVDVGGSIVLSGTSSIATYSHAVNGLGVVFNVGGDVTLASGTKISSLGWPAGRGLGYKSGACGSYGGIGGGSTAAYLYGFAAAPYQPGSGGGSRQGGGSIRLAVTGNVNLSGTISTRGVAATGSGDNAGSGGGIWITCADFLPVEGASVDAGGGMANGGNSGAAPGGGGRVAIMTGSPTEEQIDALYATGECANAVIVSTNMNDETTYSYPTLVYVAGGKRVSGTTAGAGTSYLLKNLGDRVSVEVKGNVYTPLAMPVYGLELYEPGELEFTVPKYIDVSGGEFTDASVSRYECLGYVCSNATAEICHGTDTNVTVNIAGDTTLTWIWSKVQHHFTMISGGYGSVSAHDDWYAEGTEVAIVATPDVDCNFVRWAGETTAADTSAASSTIVLDKPRRVTAVFDKPGVADRTLAISGDIDWYDPAAWDGTAIPTTNDTVTVTNSTTIALTSVMEVRSLVVSAGTLTFATGSDIPVELRVTDGIVVENGAKVVMGDANRTTFTDLTVGGDLVLNGSGTFTIYAGGGAVTSPVWTDFKRGGSKVDVGGDFVLGGTSRFETYVNRKNGLGVVFNVGGDATIAAGATIRALGHTYLDFGLSSNFKYAPYHAGTGEYGAGGGTVRLAIAGKLDLAGRIDASGGVGGGMGNAGTGGAVWITCGQLIVTDGAFVTVGGGNTSGHSSSAGGVGGTLAIMTGTPTAAQIDSLYVAGDCEERLVVTEDMSDTETSPYPTLTSCLGGTSPDSKPRRPSGTAVMLQNKANQAIVAVGGNVYTDTTEPIYGAASHDLGELMFEAPEYFYSEDGLSRYRCLGYEWSDLAGRSGSGLETWAVVDIRSDTTFTWKWSKIQHRLRTISGGYGSVAGNDEWYEEGATATLTANAGPNCAFVRWVGEFDYDGARERRSVLSLAMSRPREVIAMFRGAAPRTLTWNAASADLDWFNAANWDGEAIPSAIDAVVFTNGKFRVRHPAVIETAAWTQGGRTVGFVGTETNVLSSIITYVKPLDAANSNGYAIAVGGAMALADSAKLWFGGVNAAARHDLAVGGDLTLGNTAELEVYAGEGGDPDDWTTFRNGGAKIAVKGDLTLADKSVLLPVCHQRTGAPTVIEVVRSVRIGATAKIDADNRGYARLNGVSYGPGTHGTSSSTAYGGSYGGIGGGASPSWFPNGIGYLLAPMHPGSPGSGSSQFMAGGAVRLTANRLYLDGTISASGGNMNYGGNTYGGSGGGVWLTVRKFFPGEGFSINANGGGTYSGYAGGGGRIAVMIGSREPVVAALYRDKLYPRAKVSDMTALDDWKDRVSVLGGGNRGGGALPGNSGTARLVIAPPAGTVIIVR